MCHPCTERQISHFPGWKLIKHIWMKLLGNGSRNFNRCFVLWSLLFPAISLTCSCTSFWGLCVGGLLLRSTGAWEYCCKESDKYSDCSGECESKSMRVCLGMTISPKCSTETLHDQFPWWQIRLLSGWKTDKCVFNEHELKHLSQKQYWYKSKTA